MRRVSYPYTMWECWAAGMYNPPASVEPTATMSYELLASPADLHDAMESAVVARPVSAEHHLSDVSGNRRAWLGQAACHHAHQASMRATCVAWWRLAEPQRMAANMVADAVISDWINTHDQLALGFNYA